MRILYVSQYFPPEMGAPAARVYELSREWVRLGHQVTVLTGFPNHPTGVIPPEYRGQWLRRDIVDGIEVVRVPIYAAANRGFAKRIANYLSYAASASVVGPWVAGRPDLVLATSPQFMTAVAGYWLSRIYRAPFVFEVRDLWPRSIVAVGAMSARSPIVKALEQVELFLYRKATRVVTVTESFVDEIAARGIDRAKISVITNGVDLELFRPGSRADARAQLGLPGGFLAAYVGTHGMAHGLGMILDAAPRLRDQGVTFLLVGEGAEKPALRERASREGIENVMFWDQRPRDVIAQVYAAADVCLVLLRKDPLFTTVIPSKIFEFMGAGRAIHTTVDGESRRIIERAGAGVFSPPEDVDAFVATLRALAGDRARLEELGRSARAYVEDNYARPVLAARYAELLARIVGG
ncbi:MAG: glycosyltransferase family 4 protein [Deltaproteobacteria bacterium]|nr:glycosyltransferase family 4 protein [Deltaproteobacteria bacterium]